MKSREERKEEYIDFDCPHCGRKLRAFKEQSGSKGKCPKCGQIVDVPKV